MTTYNLRHEWMTYPNHRADIDFLDGGHGSNQYSLAIRALIVGSIIPEQKVSKQMDVLIRPIESTLNL